MGAFVLPHEWRPTGGVVLLPYEGRQTEAFKFVFGIVP
jgi:hypothetical protein